MRCQDEDPGRWLSGSTTGFFQIASIENKCDQYRYKRTHKMPLELTSGSIRTLRGLTEASLVPREQSQVQTENQDGLEKAIRLF